MKKKVIIIIITVISIIILPILAKFGIEYMATIYRIKKSDTYNKNSVAIGYGENTYNVKIPKSLGDLRLKGNVVYSFKTMKSVDTIKQEFNELYGEKNVIVKDSKYYYINAKEGFNTEEGYVICVQFDGGIFTDVNIISVRSINAGSY